MVRSASERPQVAHVVDGRGDLHLPLAVGVAHAAGGGDADVGDDTAARRRR